MEQIKINENIWTLKPGETQKYRLLELITNNRAYGNIPKDFFLDRIDMTIADLREIIDEGVYALQQSESSHE